MNEAETRAEHIDPGLKAAGCSIAWSAAFMPLHREFHFDIREPRTARTRKRRERRAPIPTGWTRALPRSRPLRAFGFAKFLSPFPRTAQVHHSARGCEARATLGRVSQLFPQPQRGCITDLSPNRCNPVGVDDVLSGSPKVASQTRQPWAECHYPVGVNRQVVTDCNQLNRSVSPAESSSLP
jgi:hypothetical protein